MQTLGEVLTLHFFAWSSVACIAAYLVFRGRRNYLLYLGACFMCVTLFLLVTGDSQRDSYLRATLAAVALVALIMSFVEGANDMKERLQKMREEEREREKAFADLQLALIEQEKNAQEPPAEAD